MVLIFILLAIVGSINITLCSNVPVVEGKQMIPYTDNVSVAEAEVNIAESMKQPISSRCPWWWFSNYRGTRYYNHDHVVIDCTGCALFCRDLACRTSSCTGTVCRCRRCLRNF